MSKVLDYEAARSEVRGRVAVNQAEFEKVRERAGAIALDVTLGNATQRDLDAVSAEQAKLTAAGEALQGALAEIDRREAEAKAAEVERKRQADERRLEELQATCNAAGAKIVALATKMGEAFAEGRAAASEAATLGRMLGRTTVKLEMWGIAGQKIVRARGFGEAGQFHPGELEAAEGEFAGRN